MSLEKDLTLPGLVHDLNNVFQTLVDAADVLSADQRWEKVSAAILRSVERGQHIAASLADGGESSALFENILASAVAFVEDSMISEAKRTDLRFVSEVEPGIELRSGWAWERVLINLFLNASRAMPEGGTIHGRARRKGSEIEITVRDDGSGIPVHLLDRIFEPRVSGQGSTGLGLHIVKTIVGQDGGAVRALNLRKGAEFAMTVPLTATVFRRNRLARAAGD
jgi:signal transduction histidine kinase